ncbi:type II toxin-antitoxin system Phd/YefM family antitoxin [Specibacter sp. NPDC078709]|uniref:type II toxin-antitoxin system Phd/YefM family antitoxin n=1 Tax=unclassified Specibacter TaxID=3081321 RepID=UPI003441DD97
MNKVSATMARQRWAETLDASRHEPVSITSHGRTIAVVMDPDLAQRALDALEELEDMADADAALTDVANGGRTYTLAEVAAELGISLNV